MVHLHFLKDCRSHQQRTKTATKPGRRVRDTARGHGILLRKLPCPKQDWKRGSHHTVRALRIQMFRTTPYKPKYKGMPPAPASGGPYLLTHFLEHALSQWFSIVLML